MGTTPVNDFEKELLLSHFTLENLHEAVFWVTSEGNIFQVNDKACQLSGYTKEELTSMQVTDINPSHIVSNFPKFWQRLKKEKKLTFIAQHKHKTGYCYDVEITGNYIEYNGQEFTCSIVRDIRQKKFEENLLRKVSEATSGLTGRDFFIELTRNITTMLGMRYSFIAECANADKSRLRTVAFVEGEKILDNIEYNTSDSACSRMMNGDTYFLPKGAQKSFKAAAGIEAYVGAPIISPTTGEILGHIAATDPNPVTEEKNQAAILKIFASRIGAEFERMKAQDELEQKNEELHRRLNEIELYNSTVKNIREQIFWINSSGKLIRVNEAVCNETGYSMEELMNMTVFDLNTSLSVKEWEKSWKETKKTGHQVIETAHRHKNGKEYPIEVTNNFIQHDGEEYFCSTARNIRKRKLEEELLRVISEATSGLTGKDFFIELARHITVTLSMRYALITECANEEKTRLRTLCYIDGEQLLDNIEYDVTGIPCEIIMRGEDFFMPREVEQFFPKEKGIESYIGVPIFSPNTNEILGHIIAIDPNPVTSEKNQLSILKIFASRAGAELDRLEAQRKLEIANEELARRLKEIETLKNQLQAENKYLQEEIKLTYNFEEIISKSKKFQKVLHQIEQVAATDATVLILGESGTGKELIARAVHNISNRSKRPLVKVNCATLPANLIESELFGHEKGAFTGAMDRKIGRFELADGGTIFLDEIGELPVELQAKLLRVLQEGEFERLGNPRTMKVNVRVIAATNRNLEKAIGNKEFREDLYYRLNVFPILCPPLRDRKEDIPLLVKHFCQKHEGKIGKKITNVPVKVMDALTTYNWPGNIRELENIIERGLILSREGSLEYGEWLPTEKAGAGKSSLQKLEDVERDHIVEVLKSTSWKVSGEKGAAKLLGLNATTLEARMKKLGIKREG